MIAKEKDYPSSLEEESSDNEMIGEIEAIYDNQGKATVGGGRKPMGQMKILHNVTEEKGRELNSIYDWLKQPSSFLYRMKGHSIYNQILNAKLS